MSKYRTMYRLWINISASVSPEHGAYVQSVGGSGDHTQLGFHEVQKSQNYLRCELGHNLPLTVHCNSFLICYEARTLKRNVSSRMSLLL